MKKHIFACIIPILALSACATPYQPDDDLGGYNQMLGGYSEKYIDQNTAIVSFNATRYTTKQAVMNGLLMRCAQVTTGAGYDYFIITSSSFSGTDVNVKTRTSYNKYITYPPHARDTAYRSIQYQSASTSPSNLPVHPPVDPNCCGVHGATAVIKMFNGPMPHGVPRAYDAKSTAAHFSPTTF